MTLHDPDRWVMGALGSAGAVLGAIAFDPTGAALAIITTTAQNADILFTVTSIFGFTVAPEVPRFQAWVPYLQGAAIGFGVLFALTLLDRFWDDLKERLL
ncbi:MAG: hypothetical protein ACOC8M_03100 [Guyparkeria sp.]